jgi:type II secretory pathway pseudopilin PulG
MRDKLRAFTLVEIIVVIGILLLLAAILFPVFRIAVAAAKHTSGKSLMRQEGIGLQLYMEEAGGLPSYDGVVASIDLPKYGCAVDDTWPAPCLSRPSPMLGSFAYVGGIEDSEVAERARRGDAVPLLADIFDSDYQPNEFDGDTPPDLTGCSRWLQCEVPERIWFFWTDGSLRVQKHKPPPKTFEEAVGPARMLFDWPGVFMLEMPATKN